MKDIERKTTVKLSGEGVVDILKNYLSSKYKECEGGDCSNSDVKLTHTQIKDNRKNEWENNYSIDYMEFEIT